MAQGRTRAAMVQAQRMKSGPKRAKKKAKAETLAHWNKLKLEGVVKGFGPPSSAYGGRNLLTGKKTKSRPRVTSTNTSYNATEKRYMRKDPYGQDN